MHNVAMIVCDSENMMFHRRRLKLRSPQITCASPAVSSGSVTSSSVPSPLLSPVSGLLAKIMVVLVTHPESGLFKSMHLKLVRR